MHTLAAATPSDPWEAWFATISSTQALIYTLGLVLALTAGLFTLRIAVKLVCGADVSYGRAAAAIGGKTLITAVMVVLAYGFILGGGTNLIAAIFLTPLDILLLTLLLRGVVVIPATAQTGWPGHLRSLLLALLVELTFVIPLWAAVFEAQKSPLR
jgi:hypothetical protein